MPNIVIEDPPCPRQNQKSKKIELRITPRKQKKQIRSIHFYKTQVEALSFDQASSACAPTRMWFRNVNRPVVQAQCSTSSRRYAATSARVSLLFVKRFSRCHVPGAIHGHGGFLRAVRDARRCRRTGQGFPAAGTPQPVLFPRRHGSRSLFGLMRSATRPTSRRSRRLRLSRTPPTLASLGPPSRRPSTTIRRHALRRSRCCESLCQLTQKDSIAAGVDDADAYACELPVNA
jgi:hypothetical protein